MKKLLSITLFLFYFIPGYLFAKPIEDPNGTTGNTYVVRFNHEIKIKAFIYKDNHETPHYAYISCVVANMSDKDYWISTGSYNFYSTINREPHWTNGSFMLTKYSTIYMNVISANGFEKTSNKFVGFMYSPNPFNPTWNWPDATFSVRCEQHYASKLPPV